MNLYIDIEWFPLPEQVVFLIGYKYGNRKTQQLIEPTRKQVAMLFAQEEISYVFVYGPDIGMLEKTFKLFIKKNYFCVNSLKLVKRLQPQQCNKLSCMEETYKIKRTQKKYKENIFQLFHDWQSPWKRKHILEYNLQDVESLKIITDDIIKKFKPNLEEYRLNPNLPMEDYDDFDYFFKSFLPKF